VFKVPAAHEIRAFLDTAGGGVLADAKDLAQGDALRDTQANSDSGVERGSGTNATSNTQGGDAIDVANDAAGTANGAFSGVPVIHPASCAEVVTDTKEGGDGDGLQALENVKDRRVEDVTREGEEAGEKKGGANQVYIGGVWDPVEDEWALPEKAPLEKDIYTPMVKIISRVMSAFVSCPPGVEREVIDTHSARFLHKDDKMTSPDIVIRAVGPSFEKPEGGDLGYSNIASFIEVKRDRDMGLSHDAHIKQLAIYVR
jgi:hypothetical protein